MKTHTNNFKNEIKKFGREISSKVFHYYTFSLISENDDYLITENDFNLVTEQFNENDKELIEEENINQITIIQDGQLLKSLMKRVELETTIDIDIKDIIKVNFGVLVNGNYEYLDYGNYIIYKKTYNANNKSWNYICYDMMLYSMIEYKRLNISYPITITKYLKAIADKMGINFASENDEFTNYNQLITKDYFQNKNMTLRDILDLLSQITASVICINNNNELEIRYPSNAGTYETVEGTNLSLENVDDIEDFNIELQGDTVQDGTPTPDSPVEIQTVSGRQEINIVGKNLFDKNNAIVENWLISNTNHNIVSNNSDRSIIVKVQSNTTYTISKMSTNRFRIGEYPTMPVVGDILNNYVRVIETNATITTLSDTNYIVINIVNISDSSYNLQDTLDSIQIEISPIATEYEEYNEQSYEINLGKNLFNHNEYPVSTTRYGVTITNNGDGSITLNGTCNVDTGNITFNLGNANVPKELAYNGDFTHTAYYVSGSCIKASTSSTRCVIRVNYNVSSSMIPLEQLNSTNNVISKTQAKRTSDVGWNWSIVIGDGDTFDNFTIKYQLEKGTEVSSFSPYKEPIELCQGKIYKDNGKWYLYKEIGKVILDGSENVSRVATNISGTYRFSITGPTDMKKNADVGLIPAGLVISNKFVEISNSASYGGSINGILVRMNNTNNFIINCIETQTYTVEQFKEWLSTNNTIVYYVLDTPTTEEITDTELIEQLEAIRLELGVNNISVESPYLSSPLKLTYLSELETIDEEMLKDVNVNFGEKFGPINKIILIDSENKIEYTSQDNISIQKNNLIEIKINDNPIILNSNNIETINNNILKKLSGIYYSINDFNSTGICYFDYLDVFKVVIEGNEYKCLLLNDEIEITQGLKEIIYSDPLENYNTEVDNYKNNNLSNKEVQQRIIKLDDNKVDNKSVLSSINNSKEKTVVGINKILNRRILSGITDSDGFLDTQLNNKYIIFSATAQFLNNDYGFIIPYYYYNNGNPKWLLKIENKNKISLINTEITVIIYYAMIKEEYEWQI